jgi:spore coat protein CotF
MLSTEKHVSALYDTSIFEFSNPEARKTLNHIQAEEQQHGEQLYAYMSCNQMYS